jgi:hypothetical protein
MYLSYIILWDTVWHSELFPFIFLSDFVRFTNILHVITTRLVELTRSWI